MSEKGGPKQEEIEVKKFSKEDILSAADLGGVLEAYRGAIGNVRGYEILGLQTAVADRLHQLGEEDKSFQFTVLASQTENADKMEKSAQIFGEVTNDFINKGSGRMTEASESFKHSAQKVVEGMEEFRLTGGRISSAANQIDQAASKIEQSSYRMG